MANDEMQVDSPHASPYVACVEALRRFVVHPNYLFTKSKQLAKQSL